MIRTFSTIPIQDSVFWPEGKSVFVSLQGSPVLLCTSMTENWTFMKIEFLASTSYVHYSREKRWQTFLEWQSKNLFLQKMALTVIYGSEIRQKKIKNAFFDVAAKWCSRLANVISAEMKNSENNLNN